MLSQSLWRKIHSGDELIHHKQEETRREGTGTLKLVTNLVLRNLVYLQQVVQRLRKSARPEPNPPLTNSMRVPQPLKQVHLSRPDEDIFRRATQPAQD